MSKPHYSCQSVSSTAITSADKLNALDLVCLWCRIPPSYISIPCSSNKLNYCINLRHHAAFAKCAGYSWPPTLCIKREGSISSNKKSPITSSPLLWQPHEPGGAPRFSGLLLLQKLKGNSRSLIHSTNNRASYPAFLNPAPSWPSSPPSQEIGAPAAKQHGHWKSCRTNKSSLRMAERFAALPTLSQATQHFHPLC